MNTNNSTRMKALEWWKSMTEEQQNAMAKKHFPNETKVGLFLITTSSRKIEEIFKKEMPL